MGTRADFYMGRGADAEWLGSIAWDGYPGGVDAAVFEAVDEKTYRAAVLSFLKREDATLPEMGWPWPWDDSGTTDYAYAFDAGMVYASSVGDAWFVVDLTAENCGEPEDAEDGSTLGGAAFPDMTAVKAVTLGKRSGVIVFGGGA